MYIDKNVVFDEKSNKYKFITQTLYTEKFPNRIHLLN